MKKDIQRVGRNEHKRWQILQQKLQKPEYSGIPKYFFSQSTLGGIIGQSIIIYPPKK